jgi:mRNA interferase YafQ
MPSSDKRTGLPRSSDFTKAFRKDWDRLSRSGRFKLKLLKEVILLLIANDAPLGPEWLDHALKGEWADHGECHVGGDFLLIYRLAERGEERSIVFVRCGTHSELFGR